MPIPIPDRSSGFTLPDISASVKLDVFFDIQCPHSKRLWPAILKLLERYAGQSMSITAHLITLSNHRQSWDMSLGLFANAKGDAQRFFDFVTFLFERQEQFMNHAFLDKTHRDLKELVADFALEHSGQPKSETLELMESNPIYIQARTPIRYAATRSVWATPTIFINNADDVPVDHTSTVEDWAKILDPLLKPLAHEQ